MMGGRDFPEKEGVSSMQDFGGALEAFERAFESRRIEDLHRYALCKEIFF